MNFKPTLLFLAALFVFGCAKEDQLKTSQSEPLPPDIQARIDAAMDDLNSEDAAPSDGEISTRGTVYLEANSHNALYNAIQLVGNGGKIILKAGNHTESSTVLVDKSVKITGQDGAILTVNAAPVTTSAPAMVAPALHISKKANVHINNLEIRAAQGTGLMAILVDHAPHSHIYDNEMHGYQFGVTIYYGSNSRIYGNTITGSPGAQAGVLNYDGEFVKIYGNDISGFTFGIFASDRKGNAYNNNLHQNVVGLLLCTVPAGTYNIGGVVNPIAIPANDWLVHKNNAHNNGWGYLVIDNAHNNILHLNDAAENSFYDIELAGDSERFGFFTPTSSNNFVCSAGDYFDIVVKDCGKDNFVVGGTHVDTATDACF